MRALAFPLTQGISPRQFYQIPSCRVVQVRGETSERRSPAAAVAAAVVHSRILQAKSVRLQQSYSEYPTNTAKGSCIVT